MRRIVLYGNSLVVSAIGASMRECPDVELVQMQASGADPTRLAESVQQLCALNPIAVLFDRATARPDFAMALLNQRPQVLFIGVDLASGEMLVLSSHEARVSTARDLIQLIEGAGAISRPCLPTEQ
jgi:hypothetical protein